jgi:ankyrin repeat protein
MNMLYIVALPSLSFLFGAVVAWTATFFAVWHSPEPKTLLEAAAENRTGTLYYMITHGADPGAAVKTKTPILQWYPPQVTSPLLVAIAKGDASVVAIMLENTQLLRESPNTQALCVVARYGHSNVAELLIENGANVSPPEGCDAERRHPEDVADASGHGNVAKMLRQYRLKSAKSSPASWRHERKAGR